MQEHLRHAHSEERPYKCEESECGKTFKLKQDWQTYLRIVHNPECSYCCRYCEHDFKTEKELDLHLLKDHSNERSYRCTEPGCYKTYTEERHLDRHVRSVHLDERPFEYPEPGCTKAYKREESLIY